MGDDHFTFTEGGHEYRVVLDGLEVRYEVKEVHGYTLVDTSALPSRDAARKAFEDMKRNKLQQLQQG